MPDRDKTISNKEQELIDKLVSMGWVWGYLSGHGDAEYVRKEIGDKTMTVADVEKEMILCPPRTVYEEPWEDL